ncbi:MAG: penicillin-binding protein 1B [Methylococcales bacterium]|nr:penicillin-binding protein 1B [Methylococcales bacterium]
MPRKTTSSSSRRTTRTTRPRYRRATRRRPSIIRWLFTKLLLAGLIAGLFGLVSYFSYLDYNVRKQFEGKRWAMPAYVYANVTEFYAGYASSVTDFEQLLQELRYRPDPQLSSESTYVKQGSKISVRTRLFRFPDQEQPSQSISVDFADGVISKITDTATEKPLAVVRLDPIQIGSFYPSRKEDRVLIKLDQTPETLIQGLLATEDRDFYEHHGISFRAIARAMWANLRAGAIVQGGSTITQQLIKNFYLSSERSFLRKFNEVFMALILEYRYEKKEILEAYLNEVYLGQDGASAVHGFGLASEFYFGRPLQNLPLHQVAMLVALVRGPSYYDPRHQDERALNRRNLVLEEMRTEGYISAQQCADAQKTDFDLIPYQHRASNRYPAFLDLVKRQLSETYHEEDLTSDGLRIFTTLDVAVQESLDAAIKRKMPELEKRSKNPQLQTAAVVTRRDSGEIVALAGGSEAQDTGFNRALDARRPIGSLIKPVIYLTALTYPDRYTIITPVSDTAIKVQISPDKQWEPHNYDNREHGVVSFHKALAQSYNLATVRIGMDLGIEMVAKTMQNLGVTRYIDLFPSLLLGASELTPFEVTQMYQTLAGDGFATPLRAIRAVINEQGKSLQSYPFTVHQSVDPAATYITNTILQEVMRTGTGKSAYSVLPHDLELVGKTGTTNESRDSWFAGFSGDYLSVVWTGRDDNKPAGLSGATGALPIWTALMHSIAKVPVSLIAPDNVETAWVNTANGMLTEESCPGSKAYPFIAGSAPTQKSGCSSEPREIKPEADVEPEPEQVPETSDSWLGDLISN